MLKPKALQDGDCIGILAPASPTVPEEVEKAGEAVERLGFRVKLASGCYARHGYLAGPDSLRADDLNAMFADPEVQGIICLRGGYGTPRIVDKLDFALIRSHPKVFVGYSDITVLHIAFNQICGMATFHGPMGASDLSKEFDAFSRESLLRAITCPEPVGLIQNPAGVAMQTLVPGEASGVIVGGNLSLIAATMGTPYEIDTCGKLLFLEDVGEEPYSVDRMLTQLALAGKFSDAAGIILGDWSDCDPKDPEKSLTLMQVFEEIIRPSGKPTLLNLKAGHCAPRITLPFGIPATLDAAKGMLTVEESAVV